MGSLTIKDFAVSLPTGNPTRQELVPSHLRHVRTEHGGELAFKALFGHGIIPLGFLVAGEN